MIAVSGDTIELTVRTDYDPHHKVLLKQADGVYRSAPGMPEQFVLGASTTNYVFFKQWYSEEMLDAGPVAGIDVRAYLPSNWKEKFRASN